MSYKKFQKKYSVGGNFFFKFVYVITTSTYVINMWSDSTMILVYIYIYIFYMYTGSFGGSLIKIPHQNTQVIFSGDLYRNSNHKIIHVPAA